MKPRTRALVVGGTVASLLLLLQIAGAHSEVLDVAPAGFEVQERVHIAAAPDRVYAALIEPKHWWSSTHSFSGDSANFTLDAKAGGCWCEVLPDGGSAQHMVVVYALPGKTLRLRGALGPFQGTGTDGALTWTIKPAADGSEVTLDSVNGGYIKGGFAPIAPIADKVMAEQVARLKAYIEAGSPDGASNRRLR